MGQIEVKCCKSQLRNGDDGLTPAEEAELARQKCAESPDDKDGPEYGQLPSTLRDSEDDAEDLGREWEKKKQAAAARKAQEAVASTENMDEQLDQDEKYAEAQRRSIARAEATRQHEKAEEEHKIALEKTRLARERLKAAEEEAKRKQEARQAEAAARQKAEADRAAAAPPLEVESDEEETKSPRETRRLSAKERLAAAKAKAQAAAASKRKELEASM